MNKFINDLYNGAWNNLELSKGSKRVFVNSGVIVGIGLIGMIVILKRNDLSKRKRKPK